MQRGNYPVPLGIR